MSDDDLSFAYMGTGKLKTVSQKEIEEAIAKALSELVGEDYSCDIEKTTYSNFGVSIKMRLSNADTTFWRGESDQKTGQNLGRKNSPK